MQGHTGRLHLMTQASMSPKVAAIAGRGEKFQECGCIWEGCREVIPDQDLIMWRCTKRPAGAPKRPNDKLQEKWGWPTGNDNESILEYMEEIVQRTWG